MIARVGICAEALSDDIDGPFEVFVQAHRETARCLLAHGDLVFAQSEDREALARAVAELATTSSDAAKAWEVVMSHARWRTAPEPVPVPLSEVEEIETLRRDWSTLVRLTIVESARAYLLGCPEQSLAFVDPDSGIEVGTFLAQWQTRTFGGLRELAGEHTVIGGTARDDLAQSRFEPLLEGARHVALLDRYIGDGLVKQYGGGGTVPRGSQEMPWLLNLIEAHAAAATVSIFTTFDDARTQEPFTAADVQSAARELWSKLGHGTGIRQLNLFTAPVVQLLNGTKTWFPHDRHLRVSSATGVSAGFALSSGFDRLRRAQTRKGTTWRLTYLWTPEDVLGLKADEEEAKRRSGQHLVLK